MRTRDFCRPSFQFNPLLTWMGIKLFHHVILQMLSDQIDQILTLKHHFAGAVMLIKCFTNIYFAMIVYRKMCFWARWHHLMDPEVVIGLATTKIGFKAQCSSWGLGMDRRINYSNLNSFNAPRGMFWSKTFFGREPILYNTQLIVYCKEVNTHLVNRHLSDQEKRSGQEFKWILIHF